MHVRSMRAREAHCARRSANIRPGMIVKKRRGGRDALQARANGPQWIEHCAGDVHHVPHVHGLRRGRGAVTRGSRASFQSRVLCSWFGTQDYAAATSTTAGGPASNHLLAAPLKAARPRQPVGKCRSFEKRVRVRHASELGIRRRQPLADRVLNEFGDTGGMQLRQDVRAVGVDRFLAHEQGRRDGLGALALGNEL